jgi:hypothetical protein
MSFERRNQRLLPRHLFFRRMALWGVAGATLLLGSLAFGVCGYHFLEDLPWIDSLLDASVILGGMGPVDPIRTTVGKLFASFYALYSGLAIIAIVGILIAPVVHRLFHKFHIETSEEER